MYSFLEMRYFIFKKVCSWVKIVSINTTYDDSHDMFKYSRLINDIN